MQATISDRQRYMRGEITFHDYYGKLVEHLGEDALRRVLPGNFTPEALAQVRRHNAGDKLWETDRGYAFEVQIIGPEGDVTGHIARVTVELDRFDAERAAR